MEKQQAAENQKFEKLIEHCITLYETFKKSGYRVDKIDEAKEARKVYEQKPEPRAIPWKNSSNIVLPLETIAVDNLEPRYTSGIVGRDPIVSFIQRNKGEVDEVLELLETWFNEELKNTVKVEDLSRKIVHSVLLDGTVFVLPKYDIEERVRRDFQYDQEGRIVIRDGKPAMSEQVDKLFEGCKAEILSMTDVFAPDNLGTIDEWERGDKIRYITPTYAELMRVKDTIGYQNIGQWLITDKTDKAQQSPQQEIQNIEVSGKEVIECIECHISYPVERILDQDVLEEDIEDFTEESIVATIALASKTIIRFVLQRDLNMNNESLIKRVRLYPEEGRTYGTSIHGKMKAVQRGASDLFNKMMNVVDIAMLPWYFYEKTAGIEGEQEIYPGAGVAVANVDKIKFANFNVNPAQFLEFFNMLLSFWERLTISDPQVGKPAEGNKTATEIMSVIQEGNIKHAYQARVFQTEVMSIFQTLYDLYYQYMPYDKTIVFQGQEILFPRNEMRRPKKFRLTGSTEQANKLLERKENEDLAMMVAANPMFAPLANPETLYTDVLKSYNKEDPRKYVLPGAVQALQMLQQYPELNQVMQQFVMQKEQGAVSQGTPVQPGV